MNQATRDFEKVLGRGLLASVSRSFYLSLRVLPSQMRGPVSLAYLLARATDTIADTPAPNDVRIAALDSLLERIGDGNGELSELQNLPQPASEDEQRLLREISRCIEWLESVDEESREEIRWVLARIGRGQRLDITRFESGPMGVKSAEELCEYTYLVAGCVGEFWTRMAVRAYPRYSDRRLEEMLVDGKALGRGLQLVNILRDFPRDLAQGRCYLPANEISTDFREAEAARHVFMHWLAKARTELDAGERYCKAVRIRRTRFACLVPVLAGRATLDLVERDFPAEGIKIARREMRACVWQALRRSM